MSSYCQYGLLILVLVFLDLVACLLFAICLIEPSIFLTEVPVKLVSCQGWLVVPQDLVNCTTPRLTREGSDWRGTYLEVVEFHQLSQLPVNLPAYDWVISQDYPGKGPYYLVITRRLRPNREKLPRIIVYYLAFAGSCLLLVLALSGLLMTPILYHCFKLPQPKVVVLEPIPPSLERAFGQVRHSFLFDRKPYHDLTIILN